MFWLLHPKKTLASLSTWPGQRIRVAPFFPPFDFLLTSNPSDVADLVAQRAIRSSISQRMLATQGINSIVVQDDELASMLRNNLRQHLTPAAYDRMSQSIVTGLIAQIDSEIANTQTVALIPLLRLEFNKALIEGLLGLPVTKDLQQQIHQVRIDVYGDDVPLAAEVDGLKKLFFFSGLPAGKVKDWLLPKTKKLAAYKARLAALIYENANQIGEQLDPQSRIASLLELCQQEKITKQQLLGEINSVFDSATPLMVSIAWALLCVAKESTHQVRIQTDNRWAKYCYLEALRLYPPFHILGYTPKPLAASKCPFKRFQLRFVDRVVHVLGLHRSTLAWNEPNQFKPERFQGGMSSVPKHAYIPFGFGQRACPGKVLSLTVGPYVLQKLTARYYFAVDEISSAKRGTLLCPHDEAKLQIRRKNQMNFGESFSVQKRI